MSSFYMAYIAADGVRKALESVGAEFDSLNVPTDGGTIFGFLNEWSVNDSYTWYGAERLAALEAKREQIIVDFLKLLPGAYSDRDGDQITLHGTMHGHTFSIRVGKALCERVQVGERTVAKVDPAFLADAPMVTESEPVYEWRCSDDILGSMSHKVGA